MRGAVEALSEANAEIERLTAELAELRAEYASDQSNWKLGEQVAFTLNRLRHVKWLAAQPQREATNAARKAATEYHRNRVPLSQQAWHDALPEFCPSCEGWLAHAQGQEEPLKAWGRMTRIGEYGARCTLCHAEFELKEEDR